MYKKEVVPAKLRSNKKLEVKVIINLYDITEINQPKVIIRSSVQIATCKHTFAEAFHEIYCRSISFWILLSGWNGLTQGYFMKISEKKALTIDCLIPLFNKCGNLYYTHETTSIERHYITPKGPHLSR